MLDIVLKALSFVFIIVIGYKLKKFGFFTATDYKIVSKIVINLTLPGAIISSFADFKMDYSLFALALLGILGNLLMIAAALLLTRKQTAAAKIFYIFTISGYNIGNFTLPFVHSFLGASGVVILCMFDLGNAIMGTGLTYALTASLIGNAQGEREPVEVKTIGKKLLQAVPFMTYICVMLLYLLNISIPRSVYDFAGILGNANAFLSMLMIGMMFEINLNKEYFTYLKEALISRYLAAFILSGLILYLQPFAEEINIVAAAALMAPMTSISAIYIEKLGGNVALAGLVGSLTIVCSVILFIVYFTWIHI